MSAAASRAVARRRRSRPSDLATLYGPSIVVFVAVVLLWQLAAGGGGRQVFPPPSAIYNAAAQQFDYLQRSALQTIYEAIGGLVIGTIGGILVAFATARWVTARDVLLPVAIASSAVPIIAVAPILNNWFGVLNPVSKMMMAALLVFFPVMINVTRGPAVDWIISHCPLVGRYTAISARPSPS